MEKKGYWCWWFGRDTWWKLFAIYWAVCAGVAVYFLLAHFHFFMDNATVFIILGLHPATIPSTYGFYDGIKDSYNEYKKQSK